MAPTGLDILMRNTVAVPQAVFPHGVHTQLLACANYHPELFRERAGTNAVTMEGIMPGDCCGHCHGRIAFSPLTCEGCHHTSGLARAAQVVQP